MTINYKEEAKAIIKELFYEDWWMTEDDWEMFERELLENGTLNYDKLASDLEIGVKNGHSVETQKELIIKIIKS